MGDGNDLVNTPAGSVTTMGEGQARGAEREAAGGGDGCFGGAGEIGGAGRSAGAGEAGEVLGGESAGASRIVGPGVLVRTEESGGEEAGGGEAEPMDGGDEQSISASEAEALWDRGTILARLTGRQRRVLELLIAGNSITESARLARISRTTIYQWIRFDSIFQSAYRQWEAEVVQSSRGRMLALMDLAVDAMERAMQRGDGRLGLLLMKEFAVVRGREGEGRK